MASISLVSVNIERSKHLDTVIPFLKQRNADVVCVQELMEDDIPNFEQELGMSGQYVGNTRHPAEGKPGIMGIGIFTNCQNAASGTKYYWGGSGAIKDFDTTDTKSRHETETRTLLYFDIKKEDVIFRIATTHFTWTPDGAPDDFQRQDLVRLLSVLESIEGFVLCGDFNAPRGGEIFAKIAEKYKDNIPTHYTSSIDPMHRAGELPYVVDGLFTTPEYSATAVEFHTGVSDHKALTAVITKL